MKRYIVKYLKYAVCIVLVSFSAGSNKDIEEYNAKALFIYNFTKFIEWENINSLEYFTISVYKKSDIVEPLKQIAETKQIQNKKINISVIKEVSQEMNCQILFLPEFLGVENYINLLKNLPRKNILIISENKKLFQNGTGINFLIQEDKIKFEINLSSIESADLRVSSQLLKLATRVNK